MGGCLEYAFELHALVAGHAYDPRHHRLIHREDTRLFQDVMRLPQFVTCLVDFQPDY